MITYRAATSADLPQVTRLLSGFSLPTADLPRDLRYFILAEDKGQIVGCVGLEVLGKHGLLRSLVVDQNFQGQRVGDELCRRIEETAKAKGITAMHLLTTTASDYFRRRGFTQSDRSTSPASISSTTEFAEMCPSTAVYMVRQLS